MNYYEQLIVSKYMDYPELKYGIIGVGTVGTAISKYLEGKGWVYFLYDKYKNIGSIEDINKADVIFIAVPTPFKDGKGDMSAVYEAVSYVIGKGKMVIINSTILPGTSDDLQKLHPELEIFFNPEFLDEDTAVEDFTAPIKQVLGYTAGQKDKADYLINALPKSSNPFVIPALEAELVKYFQNTFFATRVIFANQFYDLCEKLGADYKVVVDCASRDRRVGTSHWIIDHKGYRGFGDLNVSKCLPKDLKALLLLAKNKKVALPLLKEVDSSNDRLWNKQQNMKKDLEFNKIIELED